MYIQEILVYLIIGISVGYVIYHIIKIFVVKKQPAGCRHCNGSCGVLPNKQVFYN